MSTQLGAGAYTYTEQAWPTLPDGWSLYEVADVAVGPGDRVYVFNRGEHPMMVFEADGTFVTSWGEGVFTRAHGVTLGPDGNLYCADDDGHCIFVCTPEGEVLSTIGAPAPAQSGLPFNRPTKVAFDPATSEMYVSDGYGNARVHKYTPDGRLLFSWGEYGTDPGQFNLVHSIAVDPAGRVYVADRENHRVQIFDAEGMFLEQWVNMYRPCGLHIKDGLAYVGQLPTHLAVNADYPNIGACISVHDLTGQRLARLGDVRPGEGPGQFVAPHGLAVDSKGDLYVGEVSWSAYGRLQDPPRTARCMRKLVKRTTDG
jgi:DNA-binding beta-propeller fold protein YncE